MQTLSPSPWHSNLPRNLWPTWERSRVRRRSAPPFSSCPYCLRSLEKSVRLQRPPVYPECMSLPPCRSDALDKGAVSKRAPIRKARKECQLDKLGRSALQIRLPESCVRQRAAGNSGNFGRRRPQPDIFVFSFFSLSQNAFPYPHLTSVLCADHS